MELKDYIIVMLCSFISIDTDRLVKHNLLDLLKHEPVVPFPVLRVEKQRQDVAV
jgi:hypothetical protein